jgi:anti-sigma factor RsiW
MIFGGLTCQELVELVTDYLEEKLPPAERVRFEEHLAMCPNCPTYLEQIRRTIRALRMLPEESIAPEARQELLETFRDWKRD